MTAAIFTPAKYRQLGHQLAGFHPHCCELNRLLSRAYPIQHPINRACYSGVEDGLFAFMCQLESLARHDHPTTDLHYTFHPNGQEDYHQSPNLPGCTDAETKQLAESLQRRRLKKKKEPLTGDELRIVARCFRAVHEVCWAVVTRIMAAYDNENLPRPATGLILATWPISTACWAIMRELVQVAHEQA